jgi:hypothetical protein
MSGYVSPIQRFPYMLVPGSKPGGIGRPPVMGGPVPMPRPPIEHPIGRPPFVGGPAPMPRPPIGHPIGRPPVVGGPAPMPRPPIGRPPVTNWPETRGGQNESVQKVNLETIVIPGL